MLLQALNILKPQNEFLIERALPSEGIIDVQIKSLLKPYDVVGETFISSRQQLYPLNLKLNTNQPTFLKDDLLGFFDKKEIHAPFDGSITKESANYVFKEAPSKYQLLSGVWGTVKDIYEKNAVLIETSVIHLKFMIVSKSHFHGELIVLPNPKGELTTIYLEKYSASPEGKIVYTGDHISIAVAKKAKDVGVSALISSSISYEAYLFCKKEGIGYGVLFGFGEIETPKSVFDFLTSVSNRYVFFEAEERRLVIPVENSFKKSELKVSFLTKIKKGEEIFYFDTKLMPRLSVIDSISESSIFVRTKENKVEEVSKENAFALN